MRQNERKRKIDNNSVEQDEICNREYSLQSTWQGPWFWTKK